jgi:hypothetical protein
MSEDSKPWRMAPTVGGVEQSFFVIFLSVGVICLALFIGPSFIASEKGNVAAAVIERRGGETSAVVAARCGGYSFISGSTDSSDIPSDVPVTSAALGEDISKKKRAYGVMKEPRRKRRKRHASIRRKSRTGRPSLTRRGPAGVGTVHTDLKHSRVDSLETKPALQKFAADRIEIVGAELPAVDGMAPKTIRDEVVVGGGKNKVPAHIEKAAKAGRHKRVYYMSAAQARAQPGNHALQVLRGIAACHIGKAERAGQIFRSLPKLKQRQMKRACKTKI